MSRIEAQQIVRKYAAKLKAEKYPFSAIYLFGSFAHGNPHLWSDIDVAVVSKEMAKSRWRGRLKLREVKRMVDDRIEPHGFSPEEFKQDWMPMVHEIKKTGIRIR
jgi:predicted nucleotidyltransferase